MSHCFLKWDIKRDITLHLRTVCARSRLVQVTAPAWNQRVKAKGEGQRVQFDGKERYRVWELNKASCHLDYTIFSIVSIKRILSYFLVVIYFGNDLFFLTLIYQFCSKQGFLNKIYIFLKSDRLKKITGSDLLYQILTRLDSL